jgi:hypothetical protein
MPNLLISAAASLGPLSVDVLKSSGAHQNTSPILLSSSKSNETLRHVPPGTYAIVATRPSGESLVTQVVVGSRTAKAVIAIPAGTQHRFMTTEALRGFVSSIDQPNFSAIRRGGRSSTRAADSVSGLARVSLNSIAANNAVQAEFVPSFRTESQPGATATQESWYTLCSWDFGNISWSHPKEVDPTELTTSYIRVASPPDGGQTATAYALLDDAGFGPIVVVPRFRDGLDLTFLAEGLSAQNSADRVVNPSAARVPVAIAVPRNRSLADLLAALNAPALPNALELWRQSIDGDESSEVALNILAEKGHDLAGAVLAGHFLARFDPAEAPVDWLSNLMDYVPDCADPPVLLAWRLINGGTAEEQRIQDLLEIASRRECCLFARTRSMLTQGIRLYSRNSDASARIQSHVVTSPGGFLNYAADAGGLESFWGFEPRLPGPQTQTSIEIPTSRRIRFRDGEFSQALGATP